MNQAMKRTQIVSTGLVDQAHKKHRIDFTDDGVKSTHCSDFEYCNSITVERIAT